MKKILLMLVIFSISINEAISQFTVRVGGGAVMAKNFTYKGNLFLDVGAGVMYRDHMYVNQRFSVEGNMRVTLSARNFSNIGGAVTYGHQMKKWTLSAVVGYAYNVMSSNNDKTEKDVSNTVFSYGGRISYKDFWYLQGTTSTNADQKRIQIGAGFHFTF